MLRSEERDGEITAGNCEYYSGSFASCLPKYREYFEANIGLTVTPTNVYVWKDGYKWLVFKLNHAVGAYEHKSLGFLIGTPEGVAWGRPVILGAHRGFLNIPKDSRDAVHNAIAPRN